MDEPRCYKETPVGRLDTLYKMRQLSDLDIVGWAVFYPELAAEIVSLEDKLEDGCAKA